MANFWNNRSIHDVIRDYLYSALDECEGMQPMNIDGIVDWTCKNIVIKNYAKDFVADYLDEAIKAIQYYKPDYPYRLSDYDKTSNMMIKRAARELLSHCPIAKDYDESYHVWKKNDIRQLKNELKGLSFSFTFQRAVDSTVEDLDTYTYRFLSNRINGLENITVDLSALQRSIELPAFSEKGARDILKGNFEESMELLDNFRNDGFKVDYSNVVEMAQYVIYQKSKDILSENPYLVDLVEYSGLKHVKLDEDLIADLVNSLESQKRNIKLSKFEEIPDSRNTKVVNFKPVCGKVVDFRKQKSRCEVLY